jgi:hypothetical protein
MYKLNYSIFDGKVSTIGRLSDNACIPLCEGNTDYQAFLKWNSEQEKPLDLKSTIPVIPPEKPRDLAKEIDTLKAQVAANTTKIDTLTKP